MPYEDLGDAERIDPRTLSIALDDLLPAERTVVVDSGNFMGYPSMFLAVPDRAGFCFTQAFQSIGLGLASAIGAAVARPDRLTVAALGDGGFLMSVAELVTAVRLGLPLLVVVYNDAAYGAEVHHFGPHGHPLDTVTVPRHRPRRDRPGLRLRGDRPYGVPDDLGSGAGVAGRRRRTDRCWWTPRSPRAEARGGWKRRSAATDAPMRHFADTDVSAGRLPIVTIGTRGWRYKIPSLGRP